MLNVQFGDITYSPPTINVISIYIVLIIVCNRLCAADFFFLFLAASTAFRGPPACHTGRPIVGILTEPTQGDLTKYGTSRLQAGEL